MECKCNQCGKTFSVKYPSKKRPFCSKACSMQYRWNKTERNVKVFVCETCGKEFTVKASDHRLKEGNTIKYCSKECMGVGMRKGILKTCEICGKEFYTTRARFCSQFCAREYRKRNYQHKSYMENGYVCEFQNGYNKKGNVKQHRRIMEEFLGRKLEPDEVVHHKNGIKTDNRIENLEVMIKGEHSSYHRKKEKAEGKHLFGGYNNN